MLRDQEQRHEGVTLLTSGKGTKEVDLPSILSRPEDSPILPFGLVAYFSEPDFFFFISMKDEDHDRNSCYSSSK